MKHYFSFLIFVVVIAPPILGAEPYLFKAFPALKEKIPHLQLCSLPTPVTKLERFGEKIGHDAVYLKRDDLSGKRTENGPLYGGNKPRKLEWLLADALAHNAHTIVTYGCAGSNHALATAVYARELNLKAILMLKPQPNSDIVRHNLLLDLAVGAELRAFPNNATRDEARKKLVAENPGTYFIPTGGSTPIGALGFVNAAYELQEQIKNNVFPAPDIIYLPIGSCATTAGLALGIALAQMPTKIVAVAVEPEEFSGEFEVTTKRLFKETNELLHNADSSIPLVAFPDHLVTINTKFCGTAYGRWTQEGVLALRLFKELEQITLEGTYSTKPVNAFIDDVVHHRISHETVLIWDTYCGLSFDAATRHHPYQELPQEFWHYFEEGIQVLNALA